MSGTEGQQPETPAAENSLSAFFQSLDFKSLVVGALLGGVVGFFSDMLFEAVVDARDTAREKSAICREFDARFKRCTERLDAGDTGGAVRAFNFPGDMYPSDFPERDAVSLLRSVDGNPPKGWPPDFNSPADEIRTQVESFMREVNRRCR